MPSLMHDSEIGIQPQNDLGNGVRQDELGTGLHEKGALAGGVAAFAEQTGVLVLHFKSAGPALCAEERREGEIPCVDAYVGEVHRLTALYSEAFVAGVAATG